LAPSAFREVEFSFFLEIHAWIERELDALTQHSILLNVLVGKEIVGVVEEQRFIISSASGFNSVEE
jgi:hypothetical protein